MYRPDEWITDARIATDHGVTTRTIFDWQRRGILPKPVRLGVRTKRTLGADLNAALKKLREEQAA